MARSGASNVFGSNRKYSLDGPDNFKNMRNNIGLGITTNEKPFDPSSTSRSRTLESPRLLNASQKVGVMTDKQHDQFWAQVVNDDAKKY